MLFQLSFGRKTLMWALVWAQTLVLAPRVSRVIGIGSNYRGGGVGWLGGGVIAANGWWHGVIGVNGRWGRVVGANGVVE